MFSWADYDMVPKPQSDFARIFRRGAEYYFVRKASKYGGHLRHRTDGNLDKATALHWLLHNAARSCGAEPPQPCRPTKSPICWCERAAMHPTEKRKEAPEMDKTERMLKNVRSMGEHEYTRIVGDYAKRLYPELTRERAFVKVFTSDDAEGRAIRHFWQISKQAPLDADEAEGEAEGVEDDALEELKELAAARAASLPDAHEASCVYESLHRSGEREARAARARPEPTEVTKNLAARDFKQMRANNTPPAEAEIAPRGAKE